MADVIVSWDLPTARQQGGGLAPEDIDFTRVEMSADGGTTYTALNDVAPDAPQSVRVPDLEFGTWHFRVSTFAFVGGQGDVTEISATVEDVSAPVAVQNLQATVEY